MKSFTVNKILDRDFSMMHLLLTVYQSLHFKIIIIIIIIINNNSIIINSIIINTYYYYY